MKDPTKIRMQATKRVLRYLKGTIDFGLQLRSSPDQHLRAFYDANWVDNTSDIRSTGAYVVYFGLSVISWSCKKQSIIDKSSTKVEYHKITTTIIESHLA